MSSIVGGKLEIKGGSEFRQIVTASARELWLIAPGLKMESLIHSDPDKAPNGLRRPENSAMDLRFVEPNQRPVASLHLDDAVFNCHLQVILQHWQWGEGGFADPASGRDRPPEPKP
jgi:hypothetical protein